MLAKHRFHVTLTLVDCVCFCIAVDMSHCIGVHVHSYNTLSVNSEQLHSNAQSTLLPVCTAAACTDLLPPPPPPTPVLFVPVHMTMTPLMITHSVQTYSGLFWCFPCVLTCPSIPQCNVFTRHTSRSCSSRLRRSRQLQRHCKWSTGAWWGSRPCWPASWTLSRLLSTFCRGSSRWASPRLLYACVASYNMHHPWQMKDDKIR